MVNCTPMQVGQLNNTYSTSLLALVKQGRYIKLASTERKFCWGWFWCTGFFFALTTEWPSEWDTPPWPPPGSERDNAAEQGQERHSGQSAKQCDGKNDLICRHYFAPPIKVTPKLPSLNRLQPNHDGIFDVMCRHLCVASSVMPLLCGLSIRMASPMMP